MNYKMFQNLLLREVQKIAGDGFEVKLESIEKLNGVVRDSIVISKKSDKLAPTIYLDEFYERYRMGVSIRHLADLIVTQYQRVGVKNADRETDFFTDYQKAKSSIYCQLIHTRRNQKLLQSVPHQDFLDLSEVYYYRVREESLPEATILIKEAHREWWGISREELTMTAWENTLRDLPPKLRSLMSVMWDQIKTEHHADEAFFNHLDSMLYILSNEKGCFGAICIRYPNLLGKIADKFESDLFILPSSIHECMILPANGDYDEEILSDMVQEVNRESVDPQEVLSDRVYYYSRSQGRILE
ncbi:MAG: DUF5688 family protein [Fusicatenibacter sp.]|nr:DUF5688 family protein [Lachnospiraceae bacterium]MDY2937920.1 DUF5688 family protein [Fusicatenibacter sp.]